MKENSLNRVADLTLLFWIIKILSTTVGETAADFINVDLGLGLVSTTLVMGIVTIIIVLWNVKQKRYYVPSYWSLIIMMSIEGTLITDFLVDRLDVSLLTLDITFTFIMIFFFIVWYGKEKTLSIHKINNNVREGFYWIIVLTAFAVGTAYGDSISEYLGVGYLKSVILFGSVFLTISLLYLAKRINNVIAFWIAFVITRPLGASLGDLLVQGRQDGGLGVNIALVNVGFFGIILAATWYLLRQQGRQIETVNY